MPAFLRADNCPSRLWRQQLVSVWQKCDVALMGLSMQIGADHLDVKIDPVVNAMAVLLSGIIGHTP